MRTLRLFAVVMLGSCLSALGVPYHFDFGGGPVPDGNTVGWTSRQTLSLIPELALTDVTVTLNIAGGYNGDLYAYLTHGSGFVVLLNRVGLTAGRAYGYADAGFSSLVLSDAGSGNIHGYGGNGGLAFGPATRQPDGREISPLSTPVVFDSSSPTLTFANQFAGLDPNGEWVLFVADVSGGGGSSTVTGWSLDFMATAAAVPEPFNGGLALGVVGIGFAAIQLWQGRKPRIRVR